MVPQRRSFQTASLQYMTPFIPSAVQAVVQAIVVWDQSAPYPSPLQRSARRRQPGYALAFATDA
jgi:hypothetical protein